MNIFELLASPARRTRTITFNTSPSIHNYLHIHSNELRKSEEIKSFPQIDNFDLLTEEERLLLEGQ